MSNRNKLLLGTATAMLLSAGQVLAADIPPPPPPPEPHAESCFYVRVDGGYSFHERPDIYKNGAAPWGAGNQATNEELDDTWFIEGGVGCRVWDSIRVDATLGYRDDAGMEEAFGGLDADLSTFYGFANIYYDVFTWGRVTPYLGGGIGFARHEVDNVNLPAGLSSGKNTEFAWNLQAGVAVDLTYNLALDVGYRYADFGDARTGGGGTTMYVDDIVSHDVRVGLRYSFKDW
jgi:opacity protein-like surface antigen